MNVPSLLRVSGASALAVVSLGFVNPALASTGGQARTASTNAVPTFRAYAAGYAVRSTRSGFSVRATFTVPKISCRGRFTAFAPSVTVFTSSKHRFSDSSGPSLFIGCYQGRARYFPELVVNGSTRNYLHGSEARPGDKVVLYVSETRRRTIVSARDQTRHFTRSLSGHGSGSITFPEVADYDWLRSGTVQPVPNFGSLRFTAVKINGKRLSAFSALARYDMYSRGSGGGTLNVATGPISSGGEAFRTTFKHS
jgi:hypothetical protein